MSHTSQTSDVLQVWRQIFAQIPADENKWSGAGPTRNNSTLSGGGQSICRAGLYGGLTRFVEMAIEQPNLAFGLGTNTSTIASHW